MIYSRFNERKAKGVERVVVSTRSDALEPHRSSRAAKLERVNNLHVVVLYAH